MRDKTNRISSSILKKNRIQKLWGKKNNRGIAPPRASVAIKAHLGIWVLETKDFFPPYLAKHHERRGVLQLPHMFNPIVVSVKRRIDLQINIFRWIQSAVVRIRRPVRVVIVAISNVVAHGYALGSVLVRSVQDVV
jgi:hypothetical protein